MANTETKARAAKAAATDAAEKTAAAAKSAMKDFTAFSYPNFEMPEAFRLFAEQGMNQTRDAYARMKSAAEDATDMLEDSMETTRSEIRDAQKKALALAKENSDAAFDLFGKLLSTSSVADAVQLQTAFARARFEALVDYSKELQTSVTKFSAEASKPAKAMFDKAMTAGKAN